MFKKLLFLLLLVSLLSVSYAWKNSNNGVLVTETSLFDIRSFSILSSGNGETIIVYQDGRGEYWNTFAQKINSSGSTLWTSFGVALSTSTGDQYYPVATGDGAGGAIITWFDGRYTHAPFDNGEIFAQRVDRNGNVLWTTDGVAICTVANEQSIPVITSDNAGGAIICWRDFRNGNYDIYAQRINSVGSTLWTEGGVAICTSDNTQWWPTIATDSAGGAIIAWTDDRNLSTSSTDIYAQRIDSNGNVLWAENGIAISTVISEQVNPVITSDAVGGAIISWIDARNGNYDIYAQRINSTGSLLWTAEGVAICTAIHDQVALVITGDGASGAILTWDDMRLDSGNFIKNIFAQRVNNAGSTLWTLNGVAVCTVASQYSPVITSDNAGGAIITWYDARVENDQDIYAQRVDSTGSMLWTTNGIPVCIGNCTQYYPVITSDGANGAVIAWLDMPTDGWPFYLRIQQVDGGGVVPVELSQFDVTE